MNIGNKTKNKILVLSFIFATLMILSAFAAMSNISQMPASKTNTKGPSNFSNNLLSPLHKDFSSTGNNINPTSLYSSEPAPMGLADYGIESSGLFGTAYAYNTTSFLGGVALNSLSVTNNTTNSQLMSFQFNINLVFYNAGNMYVYWVQDVAYLNTTTHEIFFIDNVWNMSSHSQTMLNSTLSGNGVVANSSGTTWYYDQAALSLPGNNVTLTYPSDIQFMMNSTTTSQGVPEVAFMYNDGFGWQTYDNVYFSFVTNLTANLGFVVSGYQYEPNGYTPYDAELTLGGPGSGSSATDIQSNVNLTIQYWNGENYQEIPSAYNYGSHTAETIGNVVSGAYYTINDGSLFEYVTAGAGSLGQVYSSADISILNISMPLNSGVLYVNGTAHNFVNGGINLTLAPGIYQIKIYSNSLLYKEFNVNLTAGEYSPMEIAKSLVTFTSAGLPQGTEWWVNLTGHSYSSSSNTISFYEQNGTYSYSLSTDNKNYAPSNPSGVFVVSGSADSQNAVFVPVLYNVTIKENGLSSGMSWSVTSGSTTHTSKNTTISFKEMNGTYTLSVSNLTSYYTNDYSITATVNGKNVTETVNFLHYAYITGTLSPGNAILKINGKTVSVSGGAFNISVVAGNYTVTSNENGYTSYSNNFTLSAGGVKTLNITLNSNSPNNSNPISPELKYIAIGAIIIVVAGLGGFGIMRMRRK